MTETTIPFWQTSGVLTEEQSINDWLQAQHILPRWLDEVVWIYENNSPVMTAITGLKPETIQMNWKNPAVSELYFLHCACREITLGERRLVLLVSVCAKRVTAVVLAAPAAVGMYNLFPEVYVDELVQSTVSGEDFLEALDNSLSKMGRKSSSMKLFCLNTPGRKRPSKTGTNFSGAGWVKPEGDYWGTLEACHEVIHSMKTKQQKNGMVAEVTMDQILFATWFETV
jgi:hypothetical protein